MWGCGNLESCGVYEVEPLVRDVSVVFRIFFDMVTFQEDQVPLIDVLYAVWTTVLSAIYTYYDRSDTGWRETGEMVQLVVVHC